MDSMRAETSGGAIRKRYYIKLKYILCFHPKEISYLTIAGVIIISFMFFKLFHYCGIASAMAMNYVERRNWTSTSRRHIYNNKIYIAHKSK